MDRGIPLSLQFRHIVLPSKARRRGKVLNVAAAAGKTVAPLPEQLNLSAENAALVEWLFAQVGLDARQYRSETLQRRLPACLRVLRAQSGSHARQVLQDAPELLPLAISAMIIGVSSFFRDPPVFEALRNTVLPQLARSRTGLYIWSAGCSDGAELYSVALLLAELGLLPTSYLLGTDCRTDAIQRARSGWFDAAALRQVPGDLRGRYFQAGAAGWQLIPALRHSIRWRSADILATQEPGAWDAIFFRNTAIYLRAEATVPLWERFETALRPGGILVLGKAERPVGAKQLSLVGPCIYRRNRG